MSKNRQDINLLIAGAVQPLLGDGDTVGLSDTHVFIMAGAKVFMVRVDEVQNISAAADPRRAAMDFMRTLPYGPD